MPVLQVDLQPGQGLVSPGGEVSWMTSSIALSTSTSGAGSKGVLGALKRTVAGGGLFLTEYRAEGQPGTVSFAAKLPGEIRPVAIAADREYLVHRHGFLAGTEGVNLSIGFQQKLGAGIFGGSGFILQKLTGQGTAWIALSGELIEYHLAPGENLRVIPGHVGLFDAGMDFSIHDGQGRPQHAVRRRLPVPGLPDRAGDGLAADDAHLATRPRHRALPSAVRGRREQGHGIDHREHPEQLRGGWPPPPPRRSPGNDHPLVGSAPPMSVRFNPRPGSEPTKGAPRRRKCRRRNRSAGSRLSLSCGPRR